MMFYASRGTQNAFYRFRSFVRVVKEIDSKSIGHSPHEFESHSDRYEGMITLTHFFFKFVKTLFFFYSCFFLKIFLKKIKERWREKPEKEVRKSLM